MIWTKKKKYMLCIVMVALGCRFIFTDDKEINEELEQNTEKGNNIKCIVISLKLVEFIRTSYN